MALTIILSLLTVFCFHSFSSFSTGGIFIFNIVLMTCQCCCGVFCTCVTAFFLMLFFILADVGYSLGNFGYKIVDENNYALCALMKGDFNEIEKICVVGKINMKFKFSPLAYNMLGTCPNIDEPEAEAMYNYFI